MLIFVDIEASGLSSRSFPIEVGWVREDGSGESYLIRPEPSWLDWNMRAEVLHGISRARLMKEGVTAEIVARRVCQALTGHEVCSDNPAYD